METISLSSFCKEYDLAKSTVYKRAQALRINVSEGLSLEDCDRLLVEFNKVPVALVPAASVTVETGNHHITLAAPTLHQAYSLEVLRDSEVQTFEDPLLLAEQFLNVADSIATAMEQDLQQREAKLQATRSAKRQIQDKARTLQLQQQSYQDRSWILNQTTTQETADLGDALAGLQVLGKPVAGDSQES